MPKHDEGSEGDELEGQEPLLGMAAEDRSPAKKSGLLSAFMNMANSIIGAGIIGQPYAFRQAGIVAGTLLLVGLTLVVDWTIRLIVVNTKLSGSITFQGTMQHCYGRGGLIAISVAQFVFAFGGMLAFCIIVGDTVPQFVAGVFPSLASVPLLNWLTHRQAVIVLFMLGISYPLSLYRDIAKLAKASGLALVSMLVIIVAVVSQSIRSPDKDVNTASILWINSGIAQAIGVISFGESSTETKLTAAFVCHHNSLLIYGSLDRPTLDRFDQVTHWSTFVSMLACFVVALAGSAAFGDKTLGNVLNNFSSTNGIINVARLCFGLNMLTTFPLECFVCREVINNYWLPDAHLSPLAHFCITTMLVILPVAIALVVHDLGVVFELVGATSACALAYILPPLCYIKLSTRSHRTWLAWACIVFGAFVMLTSLVQSATKIFRREST